MPDIYNWKSSEESATTIKAVAYIRVDPNNKGRIDHSIGIQRYFAINHAEDLGIPEENLIILEEVAEAEDTQLNFIVSEPFFPNRVIISLIMKMAQAKGFSHLILYSIDRLTNNLIIYFELKQFFADRGIKIHYTGSDGMSCD